MVHPMHVLCVFFGVGRWLYRYVLGQIFRRWMVLIGQADWSKGDIEICMVGLSIVTVKPTRD
jgi:hypothetical protein